MKLSDAVSMKNQSPVSFLKHCTDHKLNIWLCISRTLSARKRWSVMRDCGGRRKCIIWRTQIFLDSSAQCMCVFMCAWFWYSAYKWGREKPASASERLFSLGALFFLSSITKNNEQHSEIQPLLLVLDFLCVPPPPSLFCARRAAMIKYVVWMSFDQRRHPS